jgi:hypothetical protein
MHNRNDLTASVLLERCAALAAQLKAEKLRTNLAQRDVFNLRVALEQAEQKTLEAHQQKIAALHAVRK